METPTRKVVFGDGCSISRAYEQLQELKQQNPEYLYIGTFNNHQLTSDMSEDDCYMAVLKETKAEFEQKQEEFHQAWLRKQEEHKARIPELVKEYTEKAIGVVRSDKMDFFKEILPIRVGDMYHGMEIGAMLDIIQVLNSNNMDEEKAMTESRKVFEDHGHSGMSAGLTAALVKEFSPVFGEEFYNKVYKNQ